MTVFYPDMAVKRKAIKTETEKEAVKNVFNSNTPKVIPLRKKKRHDRMPPGANRFNPISEPFIENLEDIENKRTSKAPQKRLRTPLQMSEMLQSHQISKQESIKDHFSSMALTFWFSGPNNF